MEIQRGKTVSTRHEPFCHDEMPAKMNIYSWGKKYGCGENVKARKTSSA